MRKFFTPLAVVVTLVALTSTDARAAGARIRWEESEAASRYTLFVAQPDAAEEPKIKKYRIKNPPKTTAGIAYYDVHGIDPLQPSFFVMLAISQHGRSSPGSNVIQLGTEGYCEIFDVNGDGKVTPTDALAVARKALGLKETKHFETPGSIVIAFEILKTASASQCV